MTLIGQKTKYIKKNRKFVNKHLNKLGISQIMSYQIILYKYINTQQNGNNITPKKYLIKNFLIIVCLFINFIVNTKKNAAAIEFKYLHIDLVK